MLLLAAATSGTTGHAAQDAAAAIRAILRTRFDAATAEATRIQYGGSVSAENAGDFVALPDIDGALVGGASLRADEFASICGAFAHQHRIAIGSASTA